MGAGIVDAGARLRKLLLSDRAKEADPDARSLMLEEKGEMQLELSGVAAGTVAFRLDAKGHPAIVRDGELKKICDYLLIVPRGERHHAIFVELKKTIRDDVAKPSEQLRRSLPVLEYLRSAYAVEHGEKPEFEVRYLLAGEKISRRLDKQKTRVDPAASLPRECHRGIEVRTFVGARLPVGKLTE